ncbi:MAG: hypothetical protein ACP5E5_13610 [Acidobacteriaceae bacterium]
MARHLHLTGNDGPLLWSQNEASLQKHAALDGIYVIRTSEPAERLSAEDTLRSHKSLALTERVFRTMKGLELLVRPIRHRVEDLVKARIFLCLPAYYLQWHMLRAWAPILFADEELPVQPRVRDPVLQPTISDSAKEKKATRQTPDGLAVHSSSSLMSVLAPRARVTLGPPNHPSGNTAEQLPAHNPIQATAYQLLADSPVARN